LKLAADGGCVVRCSSEPSKEQNEAVEQWDVQQEERLSLYSLADCTSETDVVQVHPGTRRREVICPT